MKLKQQRVIRNDETKKKQLFVTGKQKYVQYLVKLKRKIRRILSKNVNENDDQQY